MLNISNSVVSITESDLEKNFEIHLIRNSGPIFQSAILWSKSGRFVIDTKTNECFDKQTGKCYQLGATTKDMVYLACRHAFNLDQE